MRGEYRSVVEGLLVGAILLTFGVAVGLIAVGMWRLFNV